MTHLEIPIFSFLDYHIITEPTPGHFINVSRRGVYKMEVYSNLPRRHWSVIGEYRKRETIEFNSPENLFYVLSENSSLLLGLIASYL